MEPEASPLLAAAGLTVTSADSRGFPATSVAREVGRPVASEPLGLGIRRAAVATAGEAEGVALDATPLTAAVAHR